MLKRDAIRLFAIALACLAFGARAQAQNSPEQQWQETLARAKGQTLNLAIHIEDGYQKIVDEFQKKYPDIKVRTSIAAAQPTAVRIATEQKNGIYEWDSWWAPIANMVSTLQPAGAMAPIKDYLILPEVTDTSRWNAPDYVYLSGQPATIFVHTYQQDTSIYQNTAVKGAKPYAKPADLLDPVYKEQISIREPSGLNGGTLALAGLLREEGPDYLRRLFFDQKPVLINNPRQLLDSVVSGDRMIVIGLTGDLLSQCAEADACKTLSAWPIGSYVTTRGVTVLKNPPHPDATKVWINWLLSREGQETWVRVWATQNRAGATSLRKDVEPAAGHAPSIPAFDTLGRYTLAADQTGRSFTDQVISIYNDYNAKGR